MDNTEIKENLRDSIVIKDNDKNIVPKRRSLDRKHTMIKVIIILYCIFIIALLVTGIILRNTNIICAAVGIVAGTALGYFIQHSSNKDEWIETSKTETEGDEEES